MSKRKTGFAENEYYHLYNRGNSKQKIFHDEDDYERFSALLYLANTNKNFKIEFIKGKSLLDPSNRGEPVVAIGAWTIMPNHFHILTTQLVENGISRFMQRLTTAYSMYYNQKYGRTGALFEGRFKAEHASEDRYLKYLFSYIHLNSLKLYDRDWKEKRIDSRDAMQYLNRYTYSSYLDYHDPGARSFQLILMADKFPPYFLEKGSIEKELYEWINYRPGL